MINIKKREGITLVALVVTIVVTIILASVTYQVTIGKNGLITQAQQVRDNEALEEQEGQQKINSVTTKQDASQGTLNVIDTVAPTVNAIYASNITTTSFTINVNITEIDSGINRVEYLIGNGSYQENPLNPIATSYQFTGLAPGTTYTVKVKATDNAGQYTEVVRNITTST